MIEVWKPRVPFDVLTEIAELIENLTETNANMAMLRSGGDLEVTGFLTIDHVACIMFSLFDQIEKSYKEKWWPTRLYDWLHYGARGISIGKNFVDVDLYF